MPNWADDTCSICLDNVGVQDPAGPDDVVPPRRAPQGAETMVVELGCGGRHSFHYACVDHWVDQERADKNPGGDPAWQPTCPLCRQAFDHNVFSNTWP